MNTRPSAARSEPDVSKSTAECAPFVYRMPVRFADVDHAGIVYYPVFFHYFHVTFEEFFRDRIGPMAYVRLLDEAKIGFPAVASSCEYTAPLRFGDTVEIEMAQEKMSRRSVTMRYRAYRLREGEADRVLSAEARVTSAVVDLSQFRSVAPPEHIRSLFQQIACSDDESQ